MCLANLSDEECSLLIQNKDYFIDQYTRLLENSEFIDVITNGTAKKISIRKRNKELNRIIFETLNA